MTDPWSRQPDPSAQLTGTVRSYYSVGSETEYCKYKIINKTRLCERTKDQNIDNVNELLCIRNPSGHIHSETGRVAQSV